MTEAPNMIGEEQATQATKQTVKIRYIAMGREEIVDPDVDYQVRRTYVRAYEPVIESERSDLPPGNYFG